MGWGERGGGRDEKHSLTTGGAAPTNHVIALARSSRLAVYKRDVIMSRNVQRSARGSSDGGRGAQEGSHLGIALGVTLTTRRRCDRGASASQPRLPRRLLLEGLLPPC